MGPVAFVSLLKDAPSGTVKYFDDVLHPVAKSLSNLHARLAAIPGGVDGPYLYETCAMKILGVDYDASGGIPPELGAP
eukprot:4191071-Pyramimonas_sp.AAC.1